MTREEEKMNCLNRRTFFVLMGLIMGISMLVGCDSGKEVVDKVTGNDTVKQYHKLKKDIGKIEDRQTERYKDILEGDKTDVSERR